MKASYCPTKFSLVLLLLAATVGPAVAQAQLPPTNLGKFVHQPGDNQYTDATQTQRHGAAPVQVRRVTTAAPVVGTYHLTPAPPRPDVTLEPIAADEPVAESGFPPLPDRLDIPVVSGSSTWTASSTHANAATQQNNALNPTFHQHYGQVPAGAFMQNQGQRSYYKAQSPQNISNGNGNASNTANPNTQASNTQAASTSPPTPVTVSQSSTQDLSLPDDDFNANKQQKHGPGVGKTVSRVISGQLRQLGGMSGVRF